MELVGARGQIQRDLLYDSSGLANSTTAPKLVLPEHRSRSFLQIQCLSGGPMYFEIGAGTATAAITSGKVTSITVNNAGFNYTIPPTIKLLGGGSEGNSTFTGCGQPGYGAPGTHGFGYLNPSASTDRPASAIAVLSGGAIASITITDPGSGYVAAPFVLIENSRQDPNGCADPSKNSGSGIYLTTGGSETFNGTFCPTSPVAVYCATSGVQYTVKWTP